ncbi:hypothetical protein CR513_30896, partial [Mucuna pruriens]
MQGLGTKPIPAPKAIVYVHPPQDPSGMIGPSSGNEKLNLLKERVRAIESTGSNGLDATDFCLNSLTRAALSWYANLESGRVKTWRDLAEAFLRQYKYNEDMALDRSCLQNLSKADSEEFKDYAQRWRELVA